MFFLFLAGHLVANGPAHAQTFFGFSDNLDSYLLGDLSGQGSWFGDSGWQIQSSISQSTPNAARITATDSQFHDIQSNFGPTLLGDQVLYMRVESHEPDEIVQAVFGSGSHNYFSITIDANSDAMIFQTSVLEPIVQGWNDGAWYKFRVQWNVGTQTARVSVNDGPFTHPHVVSIDAGSSFNDVTQVFFRQRGRAVAYFDSLSTPPGITDLIDTVKSFNLRQGIENSLDAKLQSAQNALNAANSGDRPTACNLLTAFINEVTAQSARALTVNQANQLITQAEAIRSSLSCT
jgi:hypothetical protein